MDKVFTFNRITNFKEEGGQLPEIPALVYTNIPSNFKFRPYQKEALKYFIHNFEKHNNKQIWNLFHMATGSGKTNLMAALILYLYGKGYRDFIFFVNAVNIVEKTKNNFLSKDNKKYLFAQNIVINKKTVEINEVDGFADADEDNINIMFTTIQGLHDKLNTQRENSVSFSDFKDKKIVLIADEAHHLSASTKNLSKKEKNNLLSENESWENTIFRLFKENENNVLLEFTATCELNNPLIKEKYQGNPAEIIYSYPLLDFRNSGYTKDLMNLRTNLSPNERTIQALLLSQYRLKLFEKNGIANSKPVVLLKMDGETKDLDEFYDRFIEYLNFSLNESIIETIKNQSAGIIERMFEYFEANNITNADLVDELKLSFSKEHIIKIHSNVKDLAEKQILVNDLESPKNPYRLIMTLDMLHEGWDVLNLFDIVRLRNESTSKESTTKEAQLIGRGARYFPFKVECDDNAYKRKYDNDLNNEMRICETLYYHCVNDSTYINQLRESLKEVGLDFTEKEQIFEYKVKDSFKNTDAYKKGKLFLNSREKIDNSAVIEIPRSFSIESVRVLSKKATISSLCDENENTNSSEENVVTEYHFKISELAEKNKNLILKALRQFPIYRFDALKQRFPNLKSHDDFITSENYAGRYEFSIKSSEKPTILDIYDSLLDIFEKLGNKIFTKEESYHGTKEFREVELSEYVLDTKRRKNIDSAFNNEECGEGISQNSDAIPPEFKLDLSNKDWFVYNDNFGTTEEKRFVKYFSTKIDELKNKYDEVYLIRNERNFHIFSFDEGKRFEPDYVLILIKDGIVKEQQQIFIEPKGNHLVEHDKWKQDFLLQLENNAQCIHYDDNEYKIIGLPFYTHDNNEQEFKEAFKAKLALNS